MDTCAYFGQLSAAYIFKRGAGGSGPYLMIGSSGKLTFQASASINQTEHDSANNSYSLNAWQHIVATWDGGVSGAGVRFYVNGVETSYAFTDGSGVLTHNSTQPLLIGSREDFARTLDGKIDDARIYNRVLTAGEIAQLYKLGTANAAHSNVGISDGLIGYWTMDGSSIDWTKNQVSDMSGNGNTGQLQSMSTSTSPVPGKIGQGFRFFGLAGSGIDIGLNIPLDSNNWTIHMWLKWDGVQATDERLLSYYSDGPTFYIAAGSSVLHIVHSGSDDFNCGISLVAGQWTMITAARAGSVITCYKNGIPSVQSTSFSVTFTNTGGNARIGTGQGQTTFGTEDDVRIYNRALSATEVKQLYNAGR